MIQTIDRIEADTKRYVGSHFNIAERVLAIHPQSHTMSVIGCESQIAECFKEKPYQLLQQLSTAQDMCEDNGFTLTAYHTYENNLKDKHK